MAEGFAKNIIDISTGNVNQELLKIKSSDQSEARTMLDNLKYGGANSKYRGLSLPLLDLHKDHDADSLPSPTRETTPCLPIDKGFGMGHGVLKPEWPIPRVALDTNKVPMHPYETEAVKAVSTYQQKFGRSSFFMTDRLPSPTPSEEGENVDADISAEVSSSPKRHAKPEITPMVGQLGVSSFPNMNNLSVQGLNSIQNAAPSSYGLNPLLKQSFAKCRDPRLRLVNSDATAGISALPNETKEPLGGIISSKKQKIVEERVLDGPALKRPKTELANSGFIHVGRTVPGNGGWLEDRVPVGFKVAARKPELGLVDPRMPGDVANSTSSNITMPNVSVGINDKLAIPGSTASMQSILTDLVVNPSILLNFLKGQQMSANSTKSTSQPTSSNSILGAVPSTNLATPKPPVLGQGSAGILHTPSRTAALVSFCAFFFFLGDLMISCCLSPLWNSTLLWFLMAHGSLLVIDLHLTVTVWCINVCVKLTFIFVVS